MKSPPPLILASTSRYREALLRRLGLPFSCAAPGTDETAQAGESARALVARLARAKAAAVAGLRHDAWVIGSDQVAIIDSEGPDSVLGKPGSDAACIEQLSRCSGQRVSFMTAVAVLRHGRTPLEFLDTTRVLFRSLELAAIERYVRKERPLDCAGGFKSEGLGITLCESIDAKDPSALIGLPLIALSRALRTAGYELP